jgi:hypothetical protein
MFSGNHLTVQRAQVTASEKPEDDEYGYSFVCRTCPYEFIVDKEYYNRRFSRVKQVDDIMGGASAWENVDQTTGIPRCYLALLLLLLVLVCVLCGADSSADVSE